MTEDLITEDQLIPPGAKEVLPPYGFVRLVGANASDLAVVNAARVSFAKQSGWDAVGNLRPADAGVLRYLLTKKHGTPFEHTYMKFHVRAPIFVFREWHRHRIGVSINEESARYTQLEPHFYVPAAKDIRKQVGKPGAYTYEPMEPVRADAYMRALREQYGDAYHLYDLMVREGVAKEVARLVLPVAIYSQMFWTCNARSLMAFLELRNAPSAQREIRMYAEAMEAIFGQLMPETLALFISNGRTAP